MFCKEKISKEEYEEYIISISPEISLDSNDKK
jgi:hypothetical protein